MTASALAVVVTGPLAKRLGDVVGLGNTAVMVWDIAKWPVLVFVVSLMIALLYYASPNVKHPKFQWVSPGSLLAVLLWIAASALFAFYVANFGSYNKTYGALGGVIVFLTWLWITNNVILLGAEVNAEIERGRQIQGGLQPDDKEPFLEPRDTRKMKDKPRCEGRTRAAARRSRRPRRAAAFRPLTTPGFRRTRCNGSCRFSGCGCPYPRSSAPPRPVAGLPPSRPIAPPKDSAVMRTAAFIHLTGVTQPTSGTGGSRAPGVSRPGPREPASRARALAGPLTAAGPEACGRGTWGGAPPAASCRSSAPA